MRITKAGTFGKVLTIDISDDRYIENFDTNGNATIWLVQGDKTIYTSAPTSNSKISSASIDGFRQITLALSKKLTLTGAGSEGFTVSDGVSVSSVTALKGRATSASQVQLNLGIDIVLGKTYTVTHSAFGTAETSAVQKNLIFLKTANDVIAYSLNGAGVKDSWKSIVVVHNPNSASQKITLPAKGDWRVVVSGSRAGVDAFKTLKASATVNAAGQSTTVLTRD